MSKDYQNYIPESVKLTLRKEAGFGCCSCGCPILQYHHIIPLETEIHNRPEDMMALCISCHDMCTKGAITLEEQRNLKSKPRNLQQGYVDGRLKINQDFCSIRCGSCTFFGKSIPFSIDSVPLLKIGVSNNILTISISLFDDQEQLLCEIVDNDWISGDSIVWDVWSMYQKLKIRTKLGDIRLGIDATKMPLELRAKLKKNGKTVEISPKKIISTGGKGGNLNMRDAALCNTNINFDTQNNTLTIGGGALIHIEPDLNKQLEWGKAEMQKLLK